MGFAGLLQDYLRANHPIRASHHTNEMLNTLLWTGVAGKRIHVHLFLEAMKAQAASSPGAARFAMSESPSCGLATPGWGAHLIECVILAANSIF